jgi:phosphoserine phosphatase RsbU/P
VTEPDAGNTLRKVQEATGSRPLLIVDDEEILRQTTEIYLAEAGFKDIAFAENGVEALKKIAAHRPACVVLDIQMPEMDGYEVLRQLRSNVDTEDLPVLVVTSQDSREERNRILRAGASSLISKPVEGDFLIQQVMNLVEHKMLIDQLSRFHDRLSPELALAAEMQRDLIPSPTDINDIESQYGVQIASHFQTSSELGGDYWTATALDENRFGLMSVDFSGHGISAALNTFRLHLLLSRMDYNVTSPANYLSVVNDELAPIMSVGQFCTMLYAVVDIRENTLTYAGAAAPSPVFGLRDRGDIEVGDGSGLPLGIKPDVAYIDRVVKFEAGSFLFLFSDALFETERDILGLFDMDDVLSSVQKNRSFKAEVALENVLGEFYQNAPDPLPDDLTALWISR